MKLKDLAAEFDHNAVSWRVQGTPIERNGKHIAMALAYIDARDVMDRLDAVCGPENWQDKYDVLPSGLYVCHIGIRCCDDWVWKTDGAGETQVEGKKGGISDAFKRCGVKWGIGRYLYALESPWVECRVYAKNGKTFFKEWAVSPWDKVKRASYTKVDDDLTAHIAQHDSNAKADPISEAETADVSGWAAKLETVKTIFKKAKTKDELRGIWNGSGGDNSAADILRTMPDEYFEKAQDALKAIADTLPAQYVPDQIDLGDNT